MTSGVAPLLVAAAVVVVAWPARPRAARVPGAPTSPRRVAAVVPPAWFDERAAAADLRPVDRWWRLALAAPLVAALGGAGMGGPVAAVVAMACVAGAELVALSVARGRAEARLTRSVPDALDAVARSCRGGSSVVTALGALDPDVGPAADVLTDVARRVGHGVALATALDELVDSHPDPSVRLAAAALLVGADTGAAPARAVEGVAATLRDRAALEREATAHATQATASAAVLVVAPVGFGVVAMVTDPRVGGFLFGSPLGWTCLVVGVALDVVGAWWMTCMVRAAR